MTIRVLPGDCREVLKTLPDGSVHCCVTSPPYWGLRDYGVDHQIGLEVSPDVYVAEMVAVFREVRRVLRDDGTLWLNLGDAYAGSWGSQGRQGNSGQMAGRSVANIRQKSKLQAARIEAGAYPSKITKTGSIPLNSDLKPKDLIGLPWIVAFALRADGWYLRQDNIWAKRNCMPESVSGSQYVRHRIKDKSTDPPVLIPCAGCEKCERHNGFVLQMSAGRTTRAHEYVFLFSKSAQYFHDSIAIKEDGDIPAGTRAAKGAAARSDLKHVNGRPPEYYEYTGKRNKRSVWHVATQPFAAAHFATMPPAIVETCVLAGTSEKGCCSACGAPWVRQTEKRDTGKTQKMTDGWDTGAGGHGTIHRAGREKGATGVPVTVDVTTGWLPSCECGADVVPCTVLDPFGGAGTTGMVADRLSRNAVLIELNPEYIEIIKRRMTKDAGMFAEIS